VGARNNAPVHVAFRDSDHVGARDYLAFAAQWLAYALPYRRFVVILADANARLGADADRYSFIAADFHRLLFAGFYRRTKNSVQFTRRSTTISIRSVISSTATFTNTDARPRWPSGALSPPKRRLGLGKLRNPQAACRYSDIARRRA
jgi:hypothetical protein